jgi:hypothetical protein
MLITRFMVLAIKFVYSYYFLLQAAKKSETLFQLIDVDKDGTLSEQEFLRVMSSSLLRFSVSLINHYFDRAASWTKS